jgi:hypothetical protein
MALNRVASRSFLMLMIVLCVHIKFFTVIGVQEYAVCGCLSKLNPKENLSSSLEIPCNFFFHSFIFNTRQLYRPTMALERHCICTTRRANSQPINLIPARATAVQPVSIKTYFNLDMVSFFSLFFCFFHLTLSSVICKGVVMYIILGK